jgi:hypothetical protein
MSLTIFPTLVKQAVTRRLNHDIHQVVSKSKCCHQPSTTPHNTPQLAQTPTHPPSIFKCPPVINLLSSLAKNATTLATSSGLPNRPNAVSLFISSRVSLLHPSLKPGVSIIDV